MTSTFVCQHDRQFCPGGWQEFEGHCYWVGHGTWEDAEKDCISKGGHLASIHSSAEQLFIGYITYLDEVWIGGTDAAFEVGFTIYVHICTSSIQGSLSLAQ